MQDEVYFLPKFCSFVTSISIVMKSKVGWKEIPNLKN